MAISDKKRQAIDALSRDELHREIESGRKSRFSQDLDYVRYKLATIEDQENRADRAEDLAIAREANYLATGANKISAKANRISRGAFWVALFALLVSLGVLCFELYQTQHADNALQPTAESGG